MKIITCWSEYHVDSGFRRKIMERKFDPKLTWSSSKDDLINKFYKPSFVNCELYQRLSGYFSSSTFANITEEILDFIESEGRIQLITSKELSETDKEIFEHSVNEREKILSNIFLEDLKNDPDGTRLEFYKIMAYMLVNKIQDKPQLEIKIAVPTQQRALYHQKIGIMKYNNGERIAFVGSVNETGTGWHNNIESFSVFKSWGDDNTVQQGIMDNQRIFNDLWSNNEKGVDVVDLPKAVKECLFEIRPKSNQELKETIERVKKIIAEDKPKNIPEIHPRAAISLRNHQEEAIKKWNENNHKGLLEMATGTGKTFTGFGCINIIQKIHERTITIIACPQKHLVQQWSNEIRKWNNGVSDEQKIILKSPITCHSDYKWRPEFARVMGYLTNKPLGHQEYITNHIVIFTTHDTLQNPELMDKILDVRDVKKFLIIDEVHNVTQKSSQVMLPKEFDFRLGLSATPYRHMDDEGTQVLHDYFNGIVYTLNLYDAIYVLKVLSTYDYIPHYVELSQLEMEEYQRLTARIAQIESRKKKGTYRPQPNEIDPYIARSNIIANAENKDKKLGEILDELNNRLNKTLIYCTNNPSLATPENSPKQLERVQRILTERGIDSDSVTWKDKTKDRLHILELMRQGHFDCVTAVKCLDEGVDVPSVTTGIFMASSGNPKQFIQRRGRVLRKNEKEGKTHADIYDILVTPPISDIDTEFNPSQRRLIAKELLRHKEFATIARNKDQAIAKIKGIAELFEIDLDKLDYNYIQNMT